MKLSLLIMGLALINEGASAVEQKSFNYSQDELTPGKAIIIKDQVAFGLEASQQVYGVETGTRYCKVKVYDRKNKLIETMPEDVHFSQVPYQASKKETHWTENNICSNSDVKRLKWDKFKNKDGIETIGTFYAEPFDRVSAAQTSPGRISKITPDQDTCYSLQAEAFMQFMKDSQNALEVKKLREIIAIAKGKRNSQNDSDQSLNEALAKAERDYQKCFASNRHCDREQNALFFAQQRLEGFQHEFGDLPDKTAYFATIEMIDATLSEQDRVRMNELPAGTRARLAAAINEGDRTGVYGLTLQKHSLSLKVFRSHDGKCHYAGAKDIATTLKSWRENPDMLARWQKTGGEIVDNLNTKASTTSAAVASGRP